MVFTSQTMNKSSHVAPYMVTECRSKTQENSCPVFQETDPLSEWMDGFEFVIINYKINLPDLTMQII